MAQGKLGATGKYPYTLTQTPWMHTETDKLSEPCILGMHTHLFAVSHFRGFFLKNKCIIVCWQDCTILKAPAYVAFLCPTLGKTANVFQQIDKDLHKCTISFGLYE